MSTDRRIAMLGLTSVIFLGCSGLVGTLTATEVGRVPITAPGTHSTSVYVTAAPLALWTDIDVEWEGNASMDYTVQVTQDGTVLSEGTCDPLDVNLTTNARSTDIGSRHTRSHQGLLGCTVATPAEGLVDVSVTLSVKGKPTIRSADVYLKQ